MNLTVNDEKMKELMKEALTEMIQEKHEIFYDIFLEIIEDIGLLNAIKEGEKGEFVDRETIFESLNKINEH